MVLQTPGSVVDVPWRRGTRSPEADLDRARVVEELDGVEAVRRRVR